jgi:hypothetical protein
MADISSFPTIHGVLIAGDNIQTYVSAGTIKAGMVVAYADTGVSHSVAPATQALGHAAGVALYDAASGEYVAVAQDGCRVKIANGTDAAIDAGHYVMVYGTTTTGTIIEWDPAVIAHAATSNTASTGEVIGQAYDDIAASVEGIITIRIQPANSAAS